MQESCVSKPFYMLQRRQKMITVERASLSLMYEKNDESTIKRGYEKFMINYNNSYKVTKW